MYAQQNTITPPAASDLRELEDELCRDAAELPDRTSPDDYPDMLLLTPEELIGFLRVYGAAVRAEAESVPTWDDERTKLIEALQEYGDHAGWCLDRHGDLKATDECQCGWNGVRADWLVTHRPGAGK